VHLICARLNTYEPLFFFLCLCLKNDAVNGFESLDIFCSQIPSPRPRTTYGRLFSSFWVSFASLCGCAPPLFSWRFFQHFTPISLSFPALSIVIASLCIDAVCMCNIAGVRNKDPRRKWLSRASIAMCYIAIVIIVC
jgi:hypothetical protein